MRGFRGVGLLVVAALLASGCPLGGDGPRGGGPFEAEAAPCPDLVTVPCVHQVAKVELPLVGTGMSLHYGSDRVPGRKVAPRWDARSVRFGGWTLDVHHTYDPKERLLFSGGGGARSVGAAPGPGGVLLVPSADGGVVHEFEGGLQLRTVDAVTGVTLRRFSYDAGLLVGIEDRRGARTTVERNADGNPTAVVSSAGLRTELTVDQAGFLTSATGTGSAPHRVGYGKDGLLTSFTDDAQRRTSFDYDDKGRVVKSTAPDGVATIFESAEKKGLRSVQAATPSGLVTRWEYTDLPDGARRHVLTMPGGRKVEETVTSDTRTVVLPDGSRAVSSLRPDPRWRGLPAVERLSLSTPGGRAAEAELSRSVELFDPQDPLNAKTVTISVASAGSTVTRQWDGASRTLTSTTAGGMRTTQTVDERGNVTVTERPGQPTARMTYDQRGRMTQIDEGGRRTTFTPRDETGDLEVTDPSGRSWRVGTDLFGRPTSTLRPDGRRITIQRSPAGLPIGVAVDGQLVETLGWSPTGAAVSSGPASAGGEADTVAFDSDGRRAQLRRGDGRTVDYGYDPAGLVTSLRGADRETVFTRDPETGRVKSSMSPSGVGLEATYDGFLPESEGLNGPVSGKVGWRYDQTGRVTGVDIAGTTVPIEHNVDGGLLRAGDLKIDREPATGRATATAAGTVRSKREHDEFGQLRRESFTGGDRRLLDVEYEHDVLNRLTRVVETGPGGQHAVDHRYDKAGRLIATNASGGQRWTYTYDNYDNRTSVTGPDGKTATAEYDGLNRLVRAGDARYTWTPDGSLASVTTPQGATELRFDVLGHLEAMTLPDGRKVAYLIDASGRRVGRSADGRPTQGFIYGDDLHPVAETGANEEVVRRFVYAGGGAPALVFTGSGTYRVISDRTGSPRRVVDITTGSTVQELDYDPFGRIIRDTNPGFQPFGFAGGLADPSTGFVHFGARDYDPVSGRWISRDADYLAGAQINTYVYANNDPVNQWDPTGRAPQLIGGYELGGRERVPTGISFLDDMPAPPPAPAETPNFAPRGNGGLSSSPASFPTVPAANNDLPDEVGQLTGNVISVVMEGRNPGALLEISGQNIDRGVTGLRAGLFVLNAKEVYDLATTKNRSTAQTLKLIALSAGIAAEVLSVLPGGYAALAWIPLPVALFFAVALLLHQIMARSAGDPHLVTFDGFHYDFQAVGEFVGARSDDADFEIQVRHSPRGESRSVSATTALAANLGGDRVTIRGDGPTPLRVNGAAVDLPSGGIELPRGGRVSQVPDGRYVLQHPDKASMAVVTIWRGRLDVGVGVADSRRGHVLGLFGNADDNPDNDLVGPDGTPVPAKAGDHTAPLYRVFGERWRVAQSASLFDYGPGTSTSTFTDLTFPDAVATAATLDAGVRDRAAAVCRGAGVRAQPFLDDCILDVGLLGDPSYALSAATAQTAGLAQPARPAPATPSAPPNPASPGGFTPLNVGDEAAGEIRTTDDTARFSFTGRQREAIVIVPISRNNCDLTVSVTSPTGQKLLVDIGVCVGAFLELDSQGEHLLTVRTTGKPGPFRFGLRPAPAQVVRELPIGAKAQQRLSAPGEHHEYTFNGEVGDAVFLSGRSPSCDVALVLSGPDGQVVSRGSACLGVGRVILTQRGTHRIVISAPITLTGDYQLSLERSSPDQRFNIAVGDTVTFGRPGPGAGELDRPGARDIYVVDARASQNFVLRGTGPACFGARPRLGDDFLSLLSTCGDSTFTTAKAGKLELVVEGGDPPTGHYSFRLEAA
jgi:RHS repeat-associated protein